MVRIPLALALLAAAVIPTGEIQVGTVIPIMLNSRLNAAKDSPGHKITGRVMQKITLPGGAINEGARIVGHIVSATKPGESGSSIVLRFDAIEDGERRFPIATNLLAVAAMQRISEAKSPISLNSDRDPQNQWVTRQIGGDVVRRSVHAAASKDGVMGTWLEGSSVLMKLTPNPKAGCSGGPGYDRQQAVWVFSSAACGTYGLGETKITNSKESNSSGQIMLSSPGKVVVGAGSGWLLITIADNGS